MSVSGGDRTSGTGSEQRETSSGKGERLDSLEGGSESRRAHRDRFSRTDIIQAASEARFIVLERNKNIMKHYQVSSDSTT